MRYSGSKLKFVNDIKSIIEANISKNDIYVEPFVGGANVFAYINHPIKIGVDNNQYVIALWNDIKNHNFIAPTNVSKILYYDIKKDYLEKTNIYPKSLIGYVGNACSNGSAWWNGYANFNEKKKENHIIEARNGLNKQISNFLYLNSSIFLCDSYINLKLNKKCLIYCDPPYAGTKKYESNFDNDMFWNWCRKQVKKGNKVIVSEYNAPDDFICIWTKTKRDGMSITKKNIYIEKLYIHKSQLSLIKY